MISPTIGRQVWYFPTMFERKLGDQPFAATVVFVHSDRNVNLVVLGHRGEAIVKEHVRLVQGDEAAPTEKGHCEWMPYQKGQAAKAVDLDHLPDKHWRLAINAPEPLNAELPIGRIAFAENVAPEQTSTKTAMRDPLFS